MPHPDLPPPLGATPDETGTSFAVAAGHAQRVELCLFDTDDRDGSSERRIPLTDNVHGVWFARVPGVRPGQRYGYRVHGPWRPDLGHTHNPAKLLLDPYAGAIEGEVAWRPEIYGHLVDDRLAGDPEVRDDRDSAPFVPRSVVVDASAAGGVVPTRRVPWASTVIWEAHVAGATARHPGVPEELRGTYAGLAHPAVLDHLVATGVTTLELLPVHAFTSEPHLATNGRENYWGYNTLGFFAPHAAYAAATEPAEVLAEFAAMVAAYHERGLEVLLDVVYNHTCEQSRAGATLSWRGLDNAAYYRLDARGHDVDVTGCGNTLDLRDPTTLRMVLDSLRHWVTAYGVDGFRFDLAVALARGRSDDYDPDHPFLMALRTDPVLSRVKLVAEPWDVGIHGWRTGQFPAPFSEWNDRFRDAVRTFWLPDVAHPSRHAGRVDGHGVRELATRLAGSQDLFDGPSARGPLASINYVAAHDGYTLADTTAYEHKHNEANGEDNRDGHGDNRSWNHGVEGSTDDEAILAARRRSIRNLLGTTLLATGVPMLTAGDEFGRTQRGNNNAYCAAVGVRNDLSWVDWDFAPWQEDLAATTAFLTRLRRTYTVLRQRTFFSDEPRPGDGRADVLWFGRLGERMTHQAWEDPRSRVLQMLLLADETDHRPGSVDHPTSLLLVFQGKHGPAHVRLPDVDAGAGAGARTYELLWDSSWERPAPQDAEPARTPGGATDAIGPHCLRVYCVV
ncbi:glycogen debranching protein GlgX [Agilicoccus flavus]|uniref:glycogen debranching protein GlgX n=1 Tax=Agilicoccus flavus TaxID=2775968 RepID=UPI001CF7086B|nr:glycogen debranching protein GlgX [Agilicoccus flavus]